MASTAFQLLADILPVTCHAWNKDRTQVAMSPNNHEVYILKRTGDNFEKIHTLEQHGQRVCGIDWAPESNQIVTCGQDRDAYVWQLKADGTWDPQLVILRMSRAATCVKFSPDEKKFAVGSGSKLVSVCYFDPESVWWVAKHIKTDIRSTILCLDWHPNNVLIAAGGADFKVHVFSGYIKSIDEKPKATAWGKKMPFGEVMGTFGTGGGGGGWIHDVSFAPSGDKLCYVSHNSGVYVVDANNGQAVTSKMLQCLPFRTCTWVTENSFVAAGHDYYPALFTAAADGAITEHGKMDAKEAGAKKALGAMATFKRMDNQAETKAASTEVNSVHQNSISHLSIHTGTKENASVLCSTGVDGQMVLWTLAKCKHAEKIV